MKRIVIALAFLGGLALPAVAQPASEAMPCSDFLALSSEEQLVAVATAQLDEGANQAAAADPDELTMAAVVSACTERSDMLLGDAIAGALDG